MYPLGFNEYPSETSSQPNQYAPLMTVNNSSLQTMTDNSLATREALPGEIVANLLSPKRNVWHKHPQMIARSQIFFDYHQLLTGMSRELTRKLENFLDNTNQANIHQVSATNAVEVDQIVAQLLQHTHHHHDIEDMFYFPRLKQKFPQIARGIDLLDNDHKELMGTLKAIEAIKVRQTSDNNRYDAFARLYTEMAKLARLFPRHFHDEEDIIIPALGMG